MLSIGLDYHTMRSSVAILDDSGRLIQQRLIRGRYRSVLEALEAIREPFRIVFEATNGYGMLTEHLRRIRHCRRVLVAHPGQLRLIFRSKRKNDRVDAAKLAKLLFLEEVPEVHVPDLDVRAWRQLIEHRSRLVQGRAAMKNRIRALLKTHGIVAPGSLWSKKGRKWLEELRLPTSFDDLQLENLLCVLDSQDDRIGRTERVLDEHGDRHPGVQLLRTVPGIGPRTGEALVAYIDDPKRFRKVKSIGCYFGLVPCQDESAGKAKFGHITKDGPATVRSMIVESTWHAVRLSPRVRAFYERVEKGDPNRKKIAVVATAHYLLRVSLSMLRTGEVWRKESA